MGTEADTDPATEADTDTDAGTDPDTDTDAGTDPDTDADTVDITYEPFIDPTADCSDYVGSYRSYDVMDVINDIDGFDGSVDIEFRAPGDLCVFTTTMIPNHDFNDVVAYTTPNGTEVGFAVDVAVQDADVYRVDASPELAGSTTELSANVINGIFLNGILLDQLAGECWDDDCVWREDPFSDNNQFTLDSSNGHARGDGLYHYHGPPTALYVDTDSQVSGVIGYAADGFPIMGPYFDDGGTVRRAESSYELRTGARANGEPDGSYDGTYRGDYEYVGGLGDLDACNGMTVAGQYVYYVTEGFPYVVGCYLGTPHSSFGGSGGGADQCVHRHAARARRARQPCDGAPGHRPLNRCPDPGGRVR